eukprot:CAMPEP_0194233976 /NCGR_PEP_ID=MMETSP0158-20130606/1805_1 /TAXON_ID=33649 /ORGANISM="Thalassionema nitzschioides, Strain L26-B" /LENGTH=152 /DNA_ID=CAMNT_0038967019 /DNA_START=458 /DNA_END=913 /DNA_ORIENTATION=-
MKLSIAVSVLAALFSSSANAGGLPKLRAINDSINGGFDVMVKERKLRERSDITFCDTDIGGCLEVVIDPDNICDDGSVTYCLQDKATTCNDGTSGNCNGKDVCKSNPDNSMTYSHINVYVNAETSVQATSSCIEMKECNAHSNKGCDLTDLD